MPLNPEVTVAAVVMRDGRLAGELAAGASETDIMRVAVGSTSSEDVA